MITMPLFKVGIIGAGLIGGSFAQALAAFRDNPNASLAAEVFIYDRVEIDTSAYTNITYVSTIEELREVADLFILATHLDAYDDILSHFENEEKIILNAGSVQTFGQELAKKYNIPHFYMFHPIAGSEKSGWEHSTPKLFEGKLIIVDDRLKGIENYIDQMKNNVQLYENKYNVFRILDSLGPDSKDYLSAEKHDDIYGRFSHFIQFAIFNYTDSINTLYENLTNQYSESLVIPIAKDFLRLRNSSREMWDPILEYNKENIEKLTEQMKSFGGMSIPVETWPDKIQKDVKQITPTGQKSILLDFVLHELAGQNKILVEDVEMSRRIFLKYKNQYNKQDTIKSLQSLSDDEKKLLIHMQDIAHNLLMVIIGGDNTKPPEKDYLNMKYAGSGFTSVMQVLLYEME